MKYIQNCQKKSKFIISIFFLQISKIAVILNYFSLPRETNCNFSVNKIKNFAHLKFTLRSKVKIFWLYRTIMTKVRSLIKYYR